MAQLPAIELTVVIGIYPLAWHVPEARKLGVTEAVRQWQRWWPHTLVLPHPSPRNNGWLKNNPWFERELLPKVRERVGQLLL